MKLSYLAAPYSHPYDYIRAQRFDAVTKVAGRLMARGYFVFSPITHTHPMALAWGLDKGYEFWQDYNREMLNRSDALWILMIDGWQDSVGVKNEWQHAKATGKEVEWLKPSEYV